MRKHHDPKHSLASPLTDEEVKQFIRCFEQMSDSEQAVRYAFMVIMSQRVLESSREWGAA